MQTDYIYMYGMKLAQIPGKLVANNEFFNPPEYSELCALNAANTTKILSNTFVQLSEVQMKTNTTNLIYSSVHTNTPKIIMMDSRTCLERSGEAWVVSIDNTARTYVW